MPSLIIIGAIAGDVNKLKLTVLPYFIKTMIE